MTVHPPPLPRTPFKARFTDSPPSLGPSIYGLMTLATTSPADKVPTTNRLLISNFTSGGRNLLALEANKKKNYA